MNDFASHRLDVRDSRQSRSLIGRAMVGVIALAVLLPRLLAAETEAELIGLLQSQAGGPEKCQACLKLRVTGTAQCVPALAALLNDTAVAHAARNALEGLPLPEAGNALRAALATSAGLAKAGLIDSLGWRGEAASVPLVVPLLNDPEPPIAAAAAGALGRLATPEAATALAEARDRVPGAVQPVVLEALLRAADKLAPQQPELAAGLYQGLFEGSYPPPIRAAAGRALALANPQLLLEPEGAEALKTALASPDRFFRAAALAVLRQLPDAKVLEGLLGNWPELPPEAQVAMLESCVRLRVSAVPTARKAGASANPSVRIAAWQAVAELNDRESVAALAQAAVAGEAAEREVARESLTRLRGDGVLALLTAKLDQAEPGARAELLRVLGERGDPGAAEVMLRYAGGAEPARTAALKSLARMAAPALLPGLLELAAKLGPDQDAEPLLQALFAVCQASPDREQTARQVTDAMGRFGPGARRQTLPLLSELGTAPALNLALAAANDPDRELRREAVQVLGQWPSAAPAARLLELAEKSDDPGLQVLALRGAAETLGQEPDATARLAGLKRALAAAKRPEEKKLVLARIGQVQTPEALALILPFLDDPGLAEEAAVAAIATAEKVAPTQPELARETAVRVLAVAKNADALKRAWALRGVAIKPGPFLNQWLVSGPFWQAGVNGALAVFDLALGPEKPGEAVAWRAVRDTDVLPLSSMFPGQDNCVVYLKCQVVAPRELAALLLTGSDDGIKVWLNGTVVHANNIDRGWVADQDAAGVKLAAGTNEFLVKVTQGGGGWTASARLVGTDGQPIPELKVVPVPASVSNLQPQAVPAPRAEPTPVPATLPPRAQFKRLRLSDQFYAEGAYFGDFNRDGKVDVVAGPFWFEGPDFAKRHEYRPVKAYDPKDYSDNFLTYVGDFNGDGWADVFCVPFPGKDGFWYENPAGRDAAWKAHLACTEVGNESPVWGDVNGDGRPELVYCIKGYLGYAGPDPARPDEPWKFNAISAQHERYQQFTHGVGLGDLNGDERPDIIEAAGWWEQPAAPQPGQPWAFHPFRFADSGAQMLVFDVNGDGRADVVTAWHCHLYGMVWWEQVAGPGGEPGWKQHVILSPTPDVGTPAFRVSQMHALALVDMNGDGLPDVVTGKRYWAHGPAGDKEPDAPAVLFWFELHRGADGQVTFQPRLIDDNSGIGTQVTAVDLNGDRRPDVVVANKKGIFVHLNQP